MDIHATARIDIAFWQAFHTSYELIEFSRRFAHEVGPPPAETPALDNCLRAGIPLASRSSEEMAQLWGQLYAEMIDQAGPLVKDFYASFVALAPLQQQELLDRLIAAWPQTIDAAGFQAPSPAAWVAMLMLEIMGRIQRAAEVNPDLSLGSLRESDLGQIIERWDSVVSELAALDLPDVAWIRVGLEQNLAVLAERRRDRELLEKSIGWRTDIKNGADTAPQDIDQKSPYGFLKDGGTWDIRFGSEQGRFPDSHGGFRYIRELLRSPNQPMSAFRLKNPDPEAENAVKVEHTFQAMADKTAMMAYEERFRELSGDLEKAQKHNNEAEQDEIKKEMGQLTKEITASRGLFGKPRRLGSAGPKQKAKHSVGEAIRRAKEKLAETIPALVRHLDQTIQPHGTDLIYTPSCDKEHPGISWDV